MGACAIEAELIEQRRGCAMKKGTTSTSQDGNLRYAEMLQSYACVARVLKGSYGLSVRSFLLLSWLDAIFDNEINNEINAGAGSPPRRISEFASLVGVPINSATVAAAKLAQKNLLELQRAPYDARILMVQRNEAGSVLAASAATTLASVLGWPAASRSTAIRVLELHDEALRIERKVRQSNGFGLLEVRCLLALEDVHTSRVPVPNAACLAAQLGVDRASVCRALARLVRAKMARRMPGSDAREKLAAITPRGRVFLNGLIED